MAQAFEILYRAQVFARRLPHLFEHVSFIPLKSDSHVVWDVHREFLQYRTAPPLPGKVLHAINRRPEYFERRGYRYFAELENIFSLLPRELLLSKDYNAIKQGLRKILQTKELVGLIFQSPSAFSVNERWLAGSTVRTEIITTVPSRLEPRATQSFIEPNKTKFLIFASRFFHKGLNILAPVAERLLKTKPHFEFTLITPKTFAQPLPKNITSRVLPRPTLADRRALYHGHDYIVNLSLGDSLGVFLDSLRFATPMIGYPGQHGQTYCTPQTSLLLPNPIFVYDEKYLEEYNAFEYEDYLARLSTTGFFKSHEEALYEKFLIADSPERYAGLVTQLTEFSKQFSAPHWADQMRRFYTLFKFGKQYSL